MTLEETLLALLRADTVEGKNSICDEIKRNNGGAYPDWDLLAETETAETTEEETK